MLKESILDTLNLKENSSHLRYTATISKDGREYLLESQYTPTMERYTLLAEDVAQDISLDSIDIEGTDFLDDLFGGDIDVDDVLEEEEEPEKNTAEALNKWRQKYKINATDEDDEEDFCDTGEEEVEVIRDGDIQIKNPKQEDLSKAYYYKGKRVLFDFYRHVPITESNKDLYEVDPLTGQLREKSKTSKCICKNTYGDEKDFEDLTLLINKVFNFCKSKSNYVNELLKPVNNVFYSTKIYADGDITFKYTSTDKGLPYCYEYEDTKANIKIQIDMTMSKNGSGREIGTVDLGLPYVQEVLETNKTKDLKLFRKNTYNKTVIFPDPKVFKKRFNLSFMDEPDIEYIIADTPNKLYDIADKHLIPAEMLAYDAETYGLKAYKWYSKPDLLVTHSFCWAPGKSVIIPVRMKYCQNVPFDIVMEVVKPLLETKPILAHNGAADVRFNLPDGIIVNLVEDTMHLIRVIIPFMVKAAAAKGLKRGIDDLIKKAFGWDMLDLHKLVFGPAGVDFDFSLLPYDYMTYYGCPDTDLLMRLWLGLRPKLRVEQEHSYKQIVAYSKAMAILASYPGIGVQIDKMKEVRENAMNTIRQLKSLIYEYTGETEQTLPLQSAKKLSNYVFGRMGAPADKGKKTAGGALSADKHVMKALAAEVNPHPSKVFKKDIVDEDGEIVLKADDLNRSKYPFCLLHRTFADFNKDVTAFYNRIINNTLEGVYYENYRPAQTDTYRDTGAIQITKKGVKYFLGAYNDNYGFCSEDYNTEEFRITVNRSTDEALIKVLQDPESDAHTMVAAELYGLEPSEIDKSLRDPIKSCNFGIIYGMKVKRLTMQLKNTEHPTEEQLAEVQKIYDLYLYKRAEMLAPLEEARDHVRQYGWVENDLGYRMIYSQVIDVDDFLDQTFDFSNPVPPEPHFDPVKRYENMGAIMNRSGNYPIQSLAAAQLKDSVIKLYEKIEAADMLDYVFVPLSVHDEVGLIYDKRKVDPYWLFAILHESFYSEMDYLNKPKELICPLYIGVGFGTSWGNAKSDLAEFPVAFQEVVLKEFYSGTHPRLTAEEDHALHFSKRIKEYMLNRVTEMFQHMIDAKQFRRHEMKFMINKNVFLGKKMHELFHTNNEQKDPITGKKVLTLNLDKYVELILKHNHLNPEEYEIIDGPEFKKEEKRKDKKDLFEFRNELIHPLVTDDGDWLTIDATNIYPPLLTPIATYMRGLNNPNRNYHNHGVRFRINNVEYVPIEGVRLVELPISFADDLDKILSGSNIVLKNQNASGENIYMLPSPPILYDCTNHYIIFDMDIVRQIHPNMVNNIAELISEYACSPTADSYRILFRNGKNYTYSDFYMNGIPNKLPEQVKQYALSYNFTY